MCSGAGWKKGEPSLSPSPTETSKIPASSAPVGWTGVGDPGIH